jgi:hypothetical protein
MNKVCIDVNLLDCPIRTKKLSYKGQTEEYDVYRVPINELYFNDENGRIATYMSQYSSEHESQNINELSNEEYNKIIAKFIRESNGLDTFNRTLKDIENKGQLEAGVILDDGRVIDGNRRFTCLRDIYEKTSNNSFFYFECVILETPKTDNDRKELRTLELSLQFGVDEKVNYEAIDRLVSIYNDLLSPKKIYEISEYEKKFNIKKSELKLLISKAEIMIDYLNFINKPLMFHVARDYKIDGPIQELVGLRAKIDEAEWDRIKICFYYWMNKKGDRTRDVRRTKKTYETNKPAFEKILEKLIDQETKIQIEKFKNKQKEVATGNLSQTDQKQNGKNITDLPETLEKTGDIEKEFSDVNYDTRQQEARRQPLILIQQALKKIESIDTDIIGHFNQQEKEEMMELLNNIEIQMNKLKGRL